MEGLLHELDKIVNTSRPKSTQYSNFKNNVANSSKSKNQDIFLEYNLNPDDFESIYNLFVNIEPFIITQDYKNSMYIKYKDFLYSLYLITDSYDVNNNNKNYILEKGFKENKELFKIIHNKQNSLNSINTNLNNWENKLYKLLHKENTYNSTTIYDLNKFKEILEKSKDDAKNKIKNYKNQIDNLQIEIKELQRKIFNEDIFISIKMLKIIDKISLFKTYKNRMFNFINYILVEFMKGITIFDSNTDITSVVPVYHRNTSCRKKNVKCSESNSSTDKINNKISVFNCTIERIIYNELFKKYINIPQNFGHKFQLTYEEYINFNTCFPSSTLYIILEFNDIFPISLKIIHDKINEKITDIYLRELEYTQKHTIDDIIVNEIILTNIYKNNIISERKIENLIDGNIINTKESKNKTQNFSTNDREWLSGGKKNKKFNYKTIMLKHHNDLHIFYKYNNSIGFVPAEINFTHKQKSYKTEDFMTLLSSLYQKNKLSNKLSNKNWTVENWYSNDWKFNKKYFIQQFSLLSHDL